MKYLILLAMATLLMAFTPTPETSNSGDLSLNNDVKIVRILANIPHTKCPCTKGWDETDPESITYATPAGLGGEQYLAPCQRFQILGNSICEVELEQSCFSLTDISITCNDGDCSTNPTTPCETGIYCKVTFNTPCLGRKVWGINPLWLLPGQPKYKWFDCDTPACCGGNLMEARDAGGGGIVSIAPGGSAYASAWQEAACPEGGTSPTSTYTNMAFYCQDSAGGTSFTWVGNQFMNSTCGICGTGPE